MKFNKSIIGFSLIAIILQANAEYVVKVPLESNTVNFSGGESTNSITGDAVLSSYTINRGESSTISWNYQYADQIDISTLGKYSPNGSINVNPLKTTTYTVTASNADESINKNLTLTVIQPIPNISFTSNKLEIASGEEVQLNWNVSDADNIDISNLGTSLNFSDSALVYPTADITYTLTAYGYEGSGTYTDTVSIDVRNLSTINSFTSDKNKLTVGESAIFSWNVSDSEGLNLTPFGSVSGIPSGRQNVQFNTVGNFTYTLESENFNGTKTTQPLNIEVYPIPVINSFTVNGGNNITVSLNDQLNFNWSVSSSPVIELNNTDVSGLNNTILNAENIGSFTYTLEAINEAGYIVNQSLNVNVVSNGALNSFTGPNNVFIGEPFNLNWSGNSIVRYEIKSNNAGSGLSTTNVDIGTATSQIVTPTAVGSYIYTLYGYNAADAQESLTKNITVENLPTFTGFTVNGGTNINVSPNTALTFAGAGFSSGATLQGRNSGNTANATLPTTAPASAGTYTYYAAATKSLNSISKYSSLRNVVVNVIDAPVFGAITAPSTVFDNAAFTMNYSASDAVNYKIRGNVAASGISTTDVDLGTATSTSITPTAAGTYTYTITATNAAGTKTTTTRNVTVESNPTFTGFTVNGGTNINVAPSATLTFAGAGFSSGATLQGRDSGNTTNVALPATAPATAGTYTYYAAATKSLNSVSRYSALRNVVVNVINAPVFGAITAPSTVFDNAAFTLSYSASDAVNYKIRGNIAASGVSTTDVDLGTATSTSITPTAAGTYTYTITATNSVGTTTTTTRNVTVEANPTFTGFTVNGGTNINVATNATLTFAGAGFSSGATLQGRDSGNTTNVDLPAAAPATAGTYTYYAAATKSLNSVARYSTLRSVVVNTIAAPVFGTVTAPSNVFANAQFTIEYSASDAVNYKIRSNAAASGISTTDVDLGTATTTNITPTAAGTYTYTITATNSVGTKTTITRNVIVESDPTFTSVTANGVAMSTSLTLAPNATLNFVSSGLSSGAADILFQNGNPRGMSGTAPATAGTYNYAYTAFKTLNGITRSAPNRTLTLTVVNATPTIGSFTVTQHPWNECDGKTIRVGKFSYSSTNTTSLTIYYPNTSTGAAQTTTGKAVTGTTAHSMTTTDSAKYGWYKSSGWNFTLKACNGANCVTRTVKTNGNADSCSPG